MSSRKRKNTSSPSFMKQTRKKYSPQKSFNESFHFQDRPRSYSSPLLDAVFQSKDHNQPCENGNVNIISSFASTFIRELVKRIPNYVYGELHDNDTHCFLYDLNGIEKQINKKDMYKRFKKDKQTHSFVIKVLSDAPEWYHPAHWYFQTPTSPDDTTKMIQDSDTIWKGIAHKKEPVRTLNNSYALGWQVNRSNQFCMLYALYALLTEDIESSSPFEKVGLLKDSEINKREGEDYDEDESQNRNTRFIITFFCDILQKHTDLFDKYSNRSSAKKTSSTRKKKHSPIFQRTTNVFISSDILIKKQKETIRNKQKKDKMRYNEYIDDINNDDSLKRRQRSEHIKRITDEFENKKDGDNFLLNISSRDILNELNNAIRCPAMYAPQL